MQYIQTDKAPQAVGPYSQAVISGSLVYTAGQVPLTPAGTLVAKSIGSQTDQVMANLRAILEAAGSDFDHVIQTKVYLSSKDDFQEFNAAYAEYFPGNPQPARECVIASPPVEGAHVEISLVAEVK